MDLSELNAKRLSPLKQQIAKVRLGLPAPVLPTTTADKYRCTSTNRQYQKRLTPDEVTRLVADYRTGSTVYELAERFGCHRTTASDYLKAQGVRMRLAPLINDEIIRAVDLYESGLSLVKVGKILDVNAETVRQRLRERGVTIRGAHDRGSRNTQTP